jgi:hypothetical protein
MMEKSKALMAFAFNMKQLIKVPEFIQSAASSIKSDLEDLKASIEEVKADYPSYKQHGADCASAGLNDPVPCYNRVYGSIAYTISERKKWEKEFGKYHKKKHGRPFDPAEYPLTNLIQEPAKNK